MEGCNTNIINMMFFFVIFFSSYIMELLFSGLETFY